MIAKLKTIKKKSGLRRGVCRSWLINKPLENDCGKKQLDFFVSYLQNVMNNKGFLLHCSDDEYSFSFSAFFNSKELTPL